ncbi:MAG: family 16 glycoside hydrolase [Aggregatilineales bacterium]
MSIQAQAPTQTKPQSARRQPSLLAILIGLAIFMEALNLAVSGVKLLTKPGRPASGALLYATMFQNPNDADWYQYQGQSSVQIAEGTLKVSMDEPGKSIFSQLNYNFNDFDVRVVVADLNGDDPFNEYGILFRYQDLKNYYMFKVLGDGRYHVERTLNGETLDLSALHPAPSFALGANHVNDLRVVAIGSQFRFYLNDQLLTLCLKGSDKVSTWNGDKCVSKGGLSNMLTDTTFSDGQIGLGMVEDSSESVSPVQVAFSNLTIYGPQS